MKKERESNIELLRIGAMFAVLVVHIDFFALGVPSCTDIHQDWLDATLRVFFQSLTIACVDIFVFISGWFGIHPSRKGICKFLFQCLFFLIGLYLVALVMGTTTFSVEGWKGCLAATPLNWFIKAYLLLYIISPVLNAFIEKASRTDYKVVLVSFYAFQFFYGWIFPQSTGHLQGGYSTISFVGLYLWARYLYLYRPSFCQWKTCNYFISSIALVLLITGAYVVPPLCGIPVIGLGNRFLDYVSPTTLYLSASVVLGFSRLTIRNSFVNFLAASSFAVFLFHTNPNVIQHYTFFFSRLHASYPGVAYWLLSLPILVGIFLLAVLLDQFRIRLWNLLWKSQERKNSIPSEKNELIA